MVDLWGSTDTYQRFEVPTSCLLVAPCQRRASWPWHWPLPLWPGCFESPDAGRVKNCDSMGSSMIQKYDRQLFCGFNGPIKYPIAANQCIYIYTYIYIYQPSTSIGVTPPSYQYRAQQSQPRTRRQMRTTTLRKFVSSRPCLIENHITR